MKPPGSKEGVGTGEEVCVVRVGGNSSKAKQGILVTT
jgi:hypothetical protein